MGLLDRLLGREPQGQGQTRSQPQGDQPWYATGTSAPARAPRGGYGEPARRGPRSEDERAIARYRYMLRTAPPETIEEAHAEAFAQLTPEQRRIVLDDLQQDLPAGQRDPNASTDPQSLARTATRAEMRQPGTMERTLGRTGGGMGGGGIGMGGMIAGSLLGSVAGVVIGSAIANSFFNDSGYNDETGEGSEAGAEDTADSGDAGADGGDAGGDTGGDFGGDTGGGDFGGGDFGGGDFGGGDFGGGEF